MRGGFFRTTLSPHAQAAIMHQGHRMSVLTERVQTLRVLTQAGAGPSKDTGERGAGP